MKFKNVLSLFDGISCGQIALNRAGIEYDNYYASEVEPNAIKITQANYPKTVQLGDVTTLDFSKFENVDLLMGGSPCQDLSIAKADRQGLNGKRSNLFFRFVDALNQAKPKYFIFENVASMSVTEKDKITEILGVEPILINSALVSAQSRKRLYWTNIKGLKQPDDRKIFLKDIIESGLIYDNKNYCITSSYGKKSFNTDFKKRRASFVAEPVLYQLPRGKNNGGVKEDKSSTVTSSKWEYNNLCIEPVCLNPKDSDGVQPSIYNRIYSLEGKAPALLSSRFRVNVAIPCATRTWPRKKNGQPRVKRVEIRPDGKANTLTRVSTDSMVIEPIQQIQRVEMRNDGKANALTQNVNHSQVLELATPENYKKGTIITVKDKTVTAKNGVTYPIDLPDGDYLVRKFTPVETERLQTIPDNYTAHVSDTQRYKAIGNGWTVNVITHLLKSIGE